MYHSILTAIAMGDGKIHSVYKRAKVSTLVGDKAVEELCERKIIRRKQSKNADSKLYFTTPFLRFWFAFVSPLFKGIRDGDYSEVQARWENREQEFTTLTFTELSHELLKVAFKEDPIFEISEYWQNDNLEIDIFGKTKSKKTIVGSAKYTNTKVKKSELSRVQELCEKAQIKPDIFVLVAKKGFSSELKSLKGENLKLFTLKNFAKLVE